jgi:glycolate oxidase
MVTAPKLATVLRYQHKATPPWARNLKAAMPTGRLLTSPAQLAGYESDGLGYKRFRPDAVAIPGNSAELIALVRLLKDEAVPFVIRGAGTSLSGGPVAAQGGVVVHVSKLRTIERIDPEGAYAVVESGVVLNHLDEALKPHGLYYPPDPSTGPVCTLGGNVATNSGGVHCFRYGVTANYVLGVETVLLDGTVVRFGGPAGGRGEWRNDWKRLFVGSEGTLGVFTRFWLRLIPRPEKVWTFRATYPDVDRASLAIRRLATHPASPAAIELMDPRYVDMVENSPMAMGLPRGSFMILTEIDGPAFLVDRRVEAIARLLRACGSEDVTCSDQAEVRDGLWKARKAAGGLLGQISPDFVVQDAVIPKASLAAILQFIYDEADRHRIPVVNVFHAGDGNLHPNFLFDSRNPSELEAIEKIGKSLMQRVVEVGGTLSGEHGIGNDKAVYMAKHLGAMGQSMQMAIPKVFNPRHQLNPLKVFPGRRFA